jgi:hypothetical protein
MACVMLQLNIVVNGLGCVGALPGAKIFLSVLHTVSTNFAASGETPPAKRTPVLWRKRHRGPKVTRLAACGALICVVMFSAIIEVDGGEIVTAKTGVSRPSEDIRVIHGPDHKNSTRKDWLTLSKNTFSGFDGKRNDIRYFLPALAQDFSDLAAIWLSHSVVRWKIPEISGESIWRGIMVISNNAPHNHVFGGSLTGVSDVDFGNGTGNAAPSESDRFDVDVGSQLTFCRLIGQFDGCFSGFGSGDGGNGLVFDGKIGLFHFIKLAVENNNRYERKYDGEDDGGNRNPFARCGFLIGSFLLFLVGFKLLNEVVKWTRYRSAIFLVLSVASMGGAVCALLYGFLDFSFP